jgi:TM2 domain-containing membrane protein YozV
MTAYIFLLCIWFSWLLALASFTYPAFTCKGENGPTVYPTGDILCCGWCGIIGAGDNIGYLGWYANPFVILANVLYFRKRPGAALIASGCAVALSLTSFALQQVYTQGTGQGDCQIEHFGLGFYLWLATIATLLVGTLGAYLDSRFQAAIGP